MLFFLIFRTFLIRSSIRSSIPSKDSEGEKLSQSGNGGGRHLAGKFKLA